MNSPWIGLGNCRALFKDPEFLAIYGNAVLAVGLTYPVVPRGDETIRFQINAAHTEADIDHVLKALATFTG